MRSIHPVINVIELSPYAADRRTLLIILDSHFEQTSTELGWFIFTEALNTPGLLKRHIFDPVTLTLREREMKREKWREKY